MRSVFQVLLEALVIGACTIASAFMVSFVMSQLNLGYFDASNYVGLFLTGALLHITFEYTGLNLRYCQMFMDRV